jgi:OOP family OmpA-OmpF porin
MRIAAWVAGVVVLLCAPVATGEVTVASGRLVLPGPVVFETGTDKLSPASDSVLVAVRDFMQAKPDITLVRIEGHTDSDGAEAFSQRLTEARAMATAKWLTAKGIDCRRLVPVGFGSTKPLAPNDTPANKAMNRRIEFAPAALRGRPIGGLPADGGGKIAGDPCK